MSIKVQMLAMISRSKSKGKLDIVAFCDGVRPAGARPITAVTLQETGCLSRKIGLYDNIMLSAWFSARPKEQPAGQQALVALLETESLTLNDGFEVTPLGFAQLTRDNGIPIHLPTASISTRKKLFAMHWDQVRGLLKQYQEHKATQTEDTEQANAPEAEDTPEAASEES